MCIVAVFILLRIDLLSLVGNSVFRSYFILGKQRSKLAVGSHCAEVVRLRS